MATKKKILIIEDDSMIMDMYELRLGEAGYEVLKAKAGDEGLIQAKETKPDLILLDIIMPGLDGFGVLETLKKEATTKDIPVLLLTNLAQEADRAKGQKLGARDYLVKADKTPFQIVEYINKLLNQKQDVTP